MNSARGSIIKLIVVVATLLIIGVFAISVLPSVMRPKTNVQLGGGVFSAWVASDQYDREKGLSGIDRISSEQALLMVFSSSDKHGIWMKEMKFSIDIVWLDEEKKVVDVAKNIALDYPNFKTYMPTSLSGLTSSSIDMMLE